MFSKKAQGLVCWQSICLVGCFVLSSIFGFKSVAATVDASSGGPYCETEEIALFASDVVDGVYSWEGPLGFSSTEQNPRIQNSTTPQAGWYVVTVSSPSEPNDLVDSVLVVVSPKPQAGQFIGDTAVCEGNNQVSLSLLSSTGTIQDWFVSSFPTGPYSPLNIQSSTFQFQNLNSTQYYKVVVGGPNCPNDTSNIVTIRVDGYTVPGSIIGGNQDICQLKDNGSLIVENLFGSVVNWEYRPYQNPNWTTLSISSSQLIYDSLTDTSFFRAKVKNGVCPAVYTDSVVLNVKKIPVLIWDALDSCAGKQIFLENASTIETGTVAYTWLFDDGNSSTDYSTDYTYAEYGSYEVALVGLADNGCADTLVKTLHVNPFPTADFDFANVCLGDSMFFEVTTAMPFGEPIVAWEFGDGNAATVLAPGNHYSQPGSYLVKLKTQSQLGCMDSIEQLVEVFYNPQAEFLALSTCHGDSVSFYNTSQVASGSIAATSWDFGNGETSTSFSPVYTFPDQGHYSVRCWVESDKGCRDTLIQDLNIWPTPTAMFSARDTCFGAPISLVNESSVVAGDYTSQWDFGSAGNSNEETPVFVFPDTGTFEIQLIVQSDSGCRDTTLQSVQIHEARSVDAGPDLNVSKGYAVTLNVQHEGGISFQWYPEEWIEDMDAESPEVRPLESTLFHVAVMYDNGCVALDSVFVSVEDDYKLEIYNLVTPDGNGQNDVWKIINAETYSGEIEVALFDRNGNQVFYQESYDVNAGGIPETAELPDGSYFYVIAFKNSNKVYKGPLTILRNHE